jgi:hypothetical protein
MADRINFTQSINDSAQVGDILYFANVSPTDNQTNSPVTEIGPITAIGENFVEVDNGAPVGWTETEIDTGFTNVVVDGATVSVPVAPPLFMFQKDSQSNVSTLVGYFSNVRLQSGSNGKVELHSIGSEIFVSSK